MPAVTFRHYFGITDRADVVSDDGRPLGTLLRQPVRGGWHYVAQTCDGAEIYSGHRIGVALADLERHAHAGADA